MLEATYQSLPYGDGFASTGNDDPTENHFTGKERDAESGNDYMFARYYNSATGRFLSPDWDAKSSDPVPYAKLDDPQSLNLYSYVRNRPVDLADPDGHDGCCLLAEIEEVAAVTGKGVVALTLGDVIATGATLYGGYKAIESLVNPPVVSAGDKTPQEIQQQEQEEHNEAAPEPAPAAASPPRKGGGRSGKQTRLREIGKDDKTSSADRGWIASEQNQIRNGNRTSIRNPPGKDLAHRRGQEARKGYNYSHSDLQDTETHKTQHRVEKQKKKDDQ